MNNFKLVYSSMGLEEFFDNGKHIFYADMCLLALIG